MITSALTTSIRLVVMAPRPKVAPSAGTVAEWQSRAEFSRFTRPRPRESFAMR